MGVIVSQPPGGMGLVEETGEPLAAPEPEPAWGRTGGSESVKVSWNWLSSRYGPPGALPLAAM